MPIIDTAPPKPLCYLLWTMFIIRPILINLCCLSPLDLSAAFDMVDSFNLLNSPGLPTVSVSLGQSYLGLILICLTYSVPFTWIPDPPHHPSLVAMSFFRIRYLDLVYTYCLSMHLSLYPIQHMKSSIIDTLITCYYSTSHFLVLLFLKIALTSSLVSLPFTAGSCRMDWLKASKTGANPLGIHANNWPCLIMLLLSL
jgi:hypothetical protein